MRNAIWCVLYLVHIMNTIRKLIFLNDLHDYGLKFKRKIVEKESEEGRWSGWILTKESGKLIPQKVKYWQLTDRTVNDVFSSFQYHSIFLTIRIKLIIEWLELNHSWMRAYHNDFASVGPTTFLFIRKWIVEIRLELKLCFNWNEAKMYDKFQVHLIDMLL